MPKQQTPDPQDYRLQSEKLQLAREFHDLWENLGDYILKNMDTTLGLIDFNLMRLAAHGPGKLHTEEYKQLAKMFSQLLDQASALEPSDAKPSDDAWTKWFLAFISMDDCGSLSSSRYY